MTTETDIARTETGRPKLAPLDHATIIADEAAAVTRTLGSIEDPEKRLRKAVSILDDANKVLEVQEPLLRAYCLSLALYEGARAVYRAVGMTRAAFYTMTNKALGDPVFDADVDGKLSYEWPERPIGWGPSVVDRAKAKGVRYYSVAAVEIPKAAPAVVAARARRDTATRARDHLVRELAARDGGTTAELAAIIGRDRSRISHITNRPDREADALQEA